MKPCLSIVETACCLDLVLVWLLLLLSEDAINGRCLIDCLKVEDGCHSGRLVCVGD